MKFLIIIIISKMIKKYENSHKKLHNTIKKVVKQTDQMSIIQII